MIDLLPTIFSASQETIKQIQWIYIHLTILLVPCKKCSIRSDHAWFTVLEKINREGTKFYTKVCIQICCLLTSRSSLTKCAWLHAVLQKPSRGCGCTCKDDQHIVKHTQTWNVIENQWLLFQEKTSVLDGNFVMLLPFHTDLMHVSWSNTGIWYELTIRWFCQNLTVILQWKDNVLVMGLMSDLLINKEYLHTLKGVHILEADTAITDK